MEPFLLKHTIYWRPDNSHQTNKNLHEYLEKININLHEYFEERDINLHESEVRGRRERGKELKGDVSGHVTSGRRGRPMVEQMKAEAVRLWPGGQAHGS